MITIFGATCVVALVVLLLFAVVAAFGADRAWNGLAALWRGRGAGCILTVALLPFVSGCSAFPMTIAAYDSGGVGAAVSTLFRETHKRVVAACRFADGIEITSVIDVAGEIGGMGDLIDDTREDRERWCASLGGEAEIDVQG